MVLKKFVIITVAIIWLAISALGQAAGMRIMPVQELSARADTIVRGHVKKVDKASYLDYTQLATIQISDVVKGDTRLKEIKVWSGTQLINASDSFTKEGEVLIFLVHEQTFYRTLNFQNGIFNVEGETVKNWRTEPPTPVAGATPTPTPTPNPNDKIKTLQDFNLSDKSFSEVRREIESAIKSTRPDIERRF